MTKQDIVRAIKQLMPLLSESNNSWAVVGSCNLYLKGLDVKPKDIDIATSFQVVELLTARHHELMSSSTKKVSGYNPELCYLSVEVVLDNTQAEIIGEHEGDLYSRVLTDNIEMVEVNGISIPTLTLETEMECYKLSKRFEKAKLIEEFLNNRAL